MMRSPKASSGDDSGDPDSSSSDSKFPPGSPSLLGQPYMAAWGSDKVVVGATKAFGWTAAQALEMCNPGASRIGGPPHEAHPLPYSLSSLERASEELRGPMEKVWGPLKDWEVSEIR